MNKENTEKLRNDFPNLYQECDNSKFKFECMDGWFSIIYELSEKIKKVYPECVALQVKEKFGGLRFYTSPTTNEVIDMINEYGSKSYKICESCGTAENVEKRGGGWIKVLCNNCDIQYLKEQEERWK